MRIFSHSVGVSGGILFHISFLSITTRLVQARTAELITLPEQTYLKVPWCFFKYRARVGSPFTNHRFPLHDLNVPPPKNLLSYHVIHI